jgi:hypothetical protein
VAVVVVLHAALLGLYVYGRGGDPAVLVGVGADRAGRPPYEDIRSPLEAHGYDGQFYYALARAPWRRHEAGVDTPGLRHLRILYPALAFLLSGGEARLLVFVLPLINLLAIGALAALGVHLARRQGMSPWWGVLLPLALNVAMPAFRDLTDVLSTLAVCALLAAWLTGAPWWALALSATCSLLAREQNLAVVLAALAAALARRRFLACTALALALAVWGGWVAYLWRLYGGSPFASASAHFGPPLGGMGERLARLGELKTTSAIYHVFNLFAILFDVALAACLVRRRAEPVLLFTAVCGAGMALLGTFVFYDDYWASTRVFVLLPLGAWLASLQVRWRFGLAAMAGVAVMPLAVAFKTAFFRA